ncbi:MAG: NAD-dependent epimerase/dehydratase family protein, partial [Candidatus Micrarchaeota archaeon]|nr:NAD-dependent epimerase/dehydratase family protein [Candidatus Micrarchaeota archaeon]
IIVGDINDKDAVEKGVAKSDVVVHLAGLIDYSGDFERLERVNIKGTKTVAEACAKFKKRLIFASTTGVYGKKPLENPITEKTPTNPTDLYAKSKLEAERIITSYYGSFPYIILRIGVIYGPTYYSTYGKVIRMIDNGKMPIFGDGKNVIPFVHAKDVAEAIIIASKSNIANATFNIVENKTMTQERIYSYVAELLGKKYNPIRIPPAIGKILGMASSISGEEINVLSSHRVFDTERANRALGWTPKVHLIDGIKEMVEIYKSKSAKANN